MSKKSGYVYGRCKAMTAAGTRCQAGVTYAGGMTCHYHRKKPKK